MENENVVVKKSSHSRMFLSGIYNALGKQGGDPRQRHSGMTSYLMSGLHLTYIFTLAPLGEGAVGQEKGDVAKRQSLKILNQV